MNKVSNPREIPFGLLTPEYITNIGECKSALNYIYSSILKDPSVRTEMRNASPETIVEEYKFKQASCIKQELFHAAMVAAKKKLETSFTFRTALYQIGKRNTPTKINYVSTSSYLGVNGSMQHKNLQRCNYINPGGDTVTLSGYNIWGNVLTSIRNEISHITNDTTDDERYNMYRAQKMAEKVLYYESLERYISKDVNRSIPKLIDMFKKNYSSDKLGEKYFAPRDAVLKTWKLNHMYLHRDPNDIIRLVRKINISKITERNHNHFGLALFDIFFQRTIMQSNLSAHQKSVAIRMNNDGDIDTNVKRELIQQCKEQYFGKMLPADLQAAADVLYATYYFPTEEDKRKAMMESTNDFIVTADNNQEHEEFVINYGDKSSHQHLHPEYKDAKFIIDGQEFTSVSQYMVYRLINMFLLTAAEKNKYIAYMHSVTDHTKYSKLIDDLINNVNNKIAQLTLHAAGLHVKIPEMVEFLSAQSKLPAITVSSKQIPDYSNSLRAHKAPGVSVSHTSARDFFMSSRYIGDFILPTELREFASMFKNVRSCIFSRFGAEFTDMQIVDAMKRENVWFGDYDTEDVTFRGYPTILQDIDPQCHYTIVDNALKRYMSYSNSTTTSAIIMDIIETIVKKVRVYKSNILKRQVLCSNENINISIWIHLQLLQFIQKLYGILREENYFFTETHVEMACINNILFGRNPDGFKPDVGEYIEAEASNYIEDEEIFGGHSTDEAQIKKILYSEQFIDSTHVSDDTVSSIARNISLWANKPVEMNILLQCGSMFQQK